MGRGHDVTERVLWRLLLVGFGSALLFAACNGGGDSGSSISCTDLSFTSGNASPADGDVYLAPGSSSCTTVEVNVLVRNLSGIFTVAFDLTYPSGVVQYANYSAGPLLKKDNPTVTPFFNVTPVSGGLQVSMTRFTPDKSVSAVGSEVLITLRFTKIDSGSGMIDFNTGSSSLVSEEILDENGSVRPASFGTGHGGLVTVL